MARKLDSCRAHVDPDVCPRYRKETARDAEATPNVKDIGLLIGESLAQHLIYKREAPSVAHVSDVLLEIPLAEEDIVESRVALETSSLSFGQAQ
jgi:hypothetical protein